MPFMLIPHVLNTSEEIMNLTTMNRIHLKCHVIEGRVVNGLGQPKSYSFDLDKPSGYKVFCEAETNHSKKKLLDLF